MIIINLYNYNDNDICFVDILLLLYLKKIIIYKFNIFLFLI